MVNPDVSILIVDDEASIREIFVECLGFHYRCEVASSAEEAIARLQEMSFTVVLTDIQMHGSSGLELCAHIGQKYPNVVVVLMSGANDIQYAVEAIRRGAFDYIVKPFDILPTIAVVERAISHHGLLKERHEFQSTLAQTLSARTSELEAATLTISGTVDVLCLNYRATLRALARTLEARDIETGGHSERVAAYCLEIARAIGLEQTSLIGLEQGALLHDIGKIAIPDSILLKPAALTDEETAQMRLHVQHGLSIIEGIPFLRDAAHVVGGHHEKYDGSGYPNGLKADDIHIHARVFAVADALDAIMSDRPYRRGRPYAAAREEIIAHSGTHFDPLIVDAFLSIDPDVWERLRGGVEATVHPERVIDKGAIASFIGSLHRDYLPHDAALAQQGGGSQQGCDTQH